MDGIQAFMLERPYQVRKDGTDWIYTAAVHCLYKGSTMSIPQHADDSYYRLVMLTTRQLIIRAHNALIYHDEYELYFQLIDCSYSLYDLPQ